MNELHNHADVEDLKQKIKMTHAWDFILCDADTIKERYQKLYDIISTKCVRENDSDKTALVIASDAVSGFIMVCHDHRNLTYENENRDDIVFIGDFRRSCGNNGYCTDFHLYRDDKLCDEIVVAVGNEVSVIKLFNSPV